MLKINAGEKQVKLLSENRRAVIVQIQRTPLSNDCGLRCVDIIFSTTMVIWYGAKMMNQVDVFQIPQLPIEVLKSSQTDKHHLFRNMIND